MAAPPSGFDQQRFRSGTNARFTQLIILLLVAAVAVSSNFLATDDDGGFYGCVLAAGGDPNQRDPEAFFAAVWPQIDAFETCIAEYSPTMPWWSGLAWIALLLALAACVFALIPAWRTRPGRAVAAHLYDAQLPRDLEAVAAAAEVRPMPAVYVDPLAGSANAVAFGRDGRPVLMMDAGLVRLRTVDRRRYDAILRHEFAHIGNRDITITYATVALWRVFLAVTLVPFLIWLVNAVHDQVAGPSMLTGEIAFLLHQLAFAVVLIVLAYLARSDVLRTREICADLASHSDGRDLAQYETENADTAGRAKRLTRSFLGLWRAHPSWRLRAALVDDPARLFALAPLPMFLIGLATGIIGGHLEAEWLLDLGNGAWLQSMTSVLPAVLVAGAGGIAVWNAAVQALADRRPFPNGIAAGMWAGAGLAASQLVYDADADGNLVPDDPWYLLLVVAAGAALFWWIAECARLWCNARSGRPGTGPMLLVLTGAGLLAALGLAWWYGFGVRLAEGLPMSFAGLREGLIAATDPGQGDRLPTVWTIWAVVVLVCGNIALQPFVWLGSVAAWAVPLLGWALRDRPSRDPAPDAGSLEHRMPPMRRTLVIAVICGCLSWVLVFALQTTTPLWWDFTAPQGGLSAVVDFVGLLAALGVAVLAAAIAGAVARQHRLLAAVIAANLTVAIGLAGSFVILASPGCAESLIGAEATCTWIGDALWRQFRTLLIGPAFVLATAIAFTAAAATALLDHRRIPERRIRRKPRIAAPAPVRQRPVARLSVLALCAVVAGVALGAEAGKARPDDAAEQAAIDPGTLVEEPQGETPDGLRPYQLAAWGIYGGGALLRDFGEVSSGLAAAFEDAASDPIGALPVLGGLCEDFGRVVEDARQYFAIPDPALQELWDQGLSTGEIGVENCLEGLEEGDMARFWQATMIEILEASTTLSIVGEELNVQVEAGLPE